VIFPLVFQGHLCVLIQVHRGVLFISLLCDLLVRHGKRIPQDRDALGLVAVEDRALNQRGPNTPNGASECSFFSRLRRHIPIMSYLGVICKE